METTDKRWVCVCVRKNKIDMVNYDTLKGTRKESIAAILWTKTGIPVYSWRQLKKWGWKCVKVQIKISFDDK